MDLEGNESISTTPSTNNTLYLDLGSCQRGKCNTRTFTSLENQTTAVPLSRKRNVAIQSAQQHEHGGTSSTLATEQYALKISMNDSYSTPTSAAWLESDSYTNTNVTNTNGECGMANSEQSIMMDCKLEYVQQQQQQQQQQQPQSQQQQQSDILWPNEKADWGSLTPDSQSHNDINQSIRQYDSQEYYDNYHQYQHQQQYLATTVIRHTDGHLLEHTGATATPAFLDWSTTLHTPSEYVTVKNQCLNHPTYSACTTDCNDDGCLASASLEHKQQPSDHATQMRAIDDPYPHLEMQQRQNNDLRQKYQQSSNLTLDLKNISNMSVMAAGDEDSPMTPALFSPSFIDALDDIYTTTTPTPLLLDNQIYQEMDTTTSTPNILATANMNYANSSATGSHHDWHVLNQQSLPMGQYHHNSTTPHGSDVSSGRLSEQNASFIPGSTLSIGNKITEQHHASHHSLSAHLTEFNGSQRRRSSNNTASTRSSISDTLATPKSQAHIPSMHPFGQVTSMLQQYQHIYQQQKHQLSALPPSLEMTQTTPESSPLPLHSPRFDYGNSVPTESDYYSPYGNNYYHSNKSSLAILDEEEENRVFTQQQYHLENNKNKLTTSHATKLSLHQAIHNYLSRPNVATTGELTIMISTSKVAQKSYGTEKRFLCPPPSITLVGADWWTRDMLFNGESDDQLDVLRPPMIQIQIANDLARAGTVATTSIPPGCIEWITLSGLCWNEATTKIRTPSDTTTERNSDEDGKISNFKDGHLSSTAAAAAMDMDMGNNTGRSIRMNEPIVSGRCVSKNMYISDSDEKRKTVEMLVRLQLANGLDLGVFKSKEIKVISKPSKKRQSLKNMELCVHHGSTVALFNRIRSQTVSTRYLGISGMDGSPVCYDNQQQATWNFNSNNHHKDIKNICFSAKTDSWDSFLIWIVDGSRTTMGDQNIPEKKKHDGQPSWPPPPAMAMQSHSSGTLIPVYYNQPVVLQCMNTGLVSPVMIIRRVDFGNFALGGMRTADGLEAQHPGSFGVGGEYHDEDLGDPVSQLHKVAFQVVDDTISLKGHPGGYQQQQYHGIFNQIPFSLPYSIHPAKYLSCMKDVVGIYRTSGQRSQTPINKTPSQSLSAKLPAAYTDGSGENVQQVSPLLRNRRQSYQANGDYCSDYSQQFQHRHLQHDESPLPQRRRVSCDIIGKHTAEMDWTTERAYPTRTELNELPSTSSPKATKRGNRRRYSSANEQTRRFIGGGGGGTLPRRRSSILSSSNPSSSLPPDIITPVNWQEEISDTCIWSIVSTDTATYTFWPSAQGTENNEKEIIHRPVTPVPFVKECKLVKKNQMIIHGYGFTNDMIVWFGSLASTMLRVTPMKLELLVPDILLQDGQSSRCKGQEKGNGKEQVTNCMVKEENEQDEKGSTMNKVPILLVREGDGVVYRTQSWF